MYTCPCVLLLLKMQHDFVDVDARFVSLSDILFCQLLAKATFKITRDNFSMYVVQRERIVFYRTHFAMSNTGMTAKYCKMSLSQARKHK